VEGSSNKGGCERPFLGKAGRRGLRMKRCDEG
jgi:hypothetical protein